MIIKKFNDEISDQIENGEFIVKDVDFIEGRQRLNLTIVNEKRQSYMKLGVSNPEFNEKDFELSNAIVTNCLVKDYHKVFNSQYFEIAYLELQEKDSDKTTLISKSEVFAHDKY